jgi:hypothetical protein
MQEEEIRQIVREELTRQEPQESYFLAGGKLDGSPDEPGEEFISIAAFASKRTSQ